MFSNLLHLFVAPAYAHVKWFTHVSDSVPPIRENEAWAIAITVLLALVAATFAVRTKQVKHLGEQLAKRFKGKQQFVSPIIGFVGGLSLVYLGYQHQFLAPNVELANLDIQQVLAYLEIVVGISWIIGLFTRFWAAVFISLWIISLFYAGGHLINILEHTEYLAIAAYLLLAGRGVLSLDQRYWPDDSGVPASLWRLAAPLLRIGIGTSLVILAFTEKLSAIGLAQNFLDHYHWNLLSVLGVSSRGFILTIGTIELIIGLMIIFNLLPRLATLLIAGPMVLTAMLLGPAEVWGHLFAIALLAVVWLEPPQHPAHHRAKHAKTKP